MRREEGCTYSGDTYCDYMCEDCEYYQPDFLGDYGVDYTDDDEFEDEEEDDDD